MNRVIKILVTVSAAFLTMVTLAYTIPDFYNIVPIWIAPMGSIISFAIGVGLYVSKYRDMKWGGWVLYTSLFIYLVSISCIKS